MDKLGFMGVDAAMGNTVWGGGFGAEFFVFEREAYLHTSSDENEKNKQNTISWKKTAGFQP